MGPRTAQGGARCWVEDDDGGVQFEVRVNSAHDVQQARPATDNVIPAIFFNESPPVILAKAGIHEIFWIPAKSLPE